MTQPTPASPFPQPTQLPGAPGVFPAAQQLTVADPLCGHVNDEHHDESCAYWRGVAAGEYPHPDAYTVDITDGLLTTIREPLVFPAPLVDPALRGAA